MRKHSQHTSEAREKIRRARLGTSHTHEAKAKISAARTKRELEAAVYRAQN